MAFKLEFETGNAAFQDGGDSAQIADILCDIGAQFRSGFYTMGAPVPIRDINGNRVGTWTYTQD